ncbi:MAG TPA: tRNA 2-thiocytidine biosynthesis TtcA family protein [Bacteroidales bacterium]|nr:tRNA 2-thiocytidine biosynthesis TtcA family protein [Bacteroidales bacterium]
MPKQNTSSNLLVAKVLKANQRFNLIGNGDSVLAAISGGSDSLLMLEALYRLLRSRKLDFQLSALHVSTENVDYSIDREKLDEFCHIRNIPVFFRSFRFEPSKQTEKSPCFYCSWHRRKELYRFAKENNCNKLALGHHADDAIETLIINMCYHKAISSLPAKLSMFNGDLQLIRPLILFSKAELTKVAELLSLNSFASECSFADNTKRQKAASVIAFMEEHFPGARKKLFEAMSSVHTAYLPADEGKSPIIEGLNVIHPKD